MADITTFIYAAEDPIEGAITQNGRVKRRFKLTTAAGEYPTGGIPLDNLKLGYPTVLESLIVLEGDVADPLLTYEWDKSANTIFVKEDDVTSGVPAQHANATFTSPDELIVEVIGW